MGRAKAAEFSCRKWATHYVRLHLQTGRLSERRLRERVVVYRMCLWDVLANEGRALSPYRHLECILPPAQRFALAEHALLAAPADVRLSC